MKLRNDLIAAETAKTESDAANEATQVSLSYLQAELQQVKDTEDERTRTIDAAKAESEKLRAELSAAAAAQLAAAAKVRIPPLKCQCVFVYLRVLCELTQH